MGIKEPINRLPSWMKMKSRLPKDGDYYKVRELVDKNKLHTICTSGNCPNIGECWDSGTATFMILGDVCTRSCKFCNVKTGIPNKVDLEEPQKIANSVKELNLNHVVITSVDRDDLEDGGALHFANVVTSIKSLNSNTTVEILTPDFLRKKDSYKIVVDSNPDVFNHNLETVPSLYLKVRPGSRYFQSLNLLANVKIHNPEIFTKSGLMVGLGETKDELCQVMDDLRCANVDFITIGQYLQPTPQHYPIKKFITPDEFETYKEIAYSKGFLMVSSSPLTRSSYHAGEDFAVLQANRKSGIENCQ